MRGHRCKYPFSRVIFIVRLRSTFGTIAKHFIMLFQGVENPDELKKHISTVKELVLRRSYKKDSTIDRTAEEILEKMFRSIL